MSYRYDVLPLGQAAAPELQSQSDECEQRTAWASSQGEVPAPEKTWRKTSTGDILFIHLHFIKVDFKAIWTEYFMCLWNILRCTYKHRH